MTVRVLDGDCRDVLDKLDTGSVQCCVTSPRGDMVLDPFGGAGTTGLVADRLGRDAILIELNPEYATLARDRIRGDSPLFADVDGAA